VKISIIGAAGLRTPLLLSGLLRSDLPITRVDLYDPDQQRLDDLFGVLRAVAPDETLVRRCRSSAQAIADSFFVLTSIRVGGMAQRARDELVALRLGVLGQETVGPVGFAMAMRTVDPMLGYARQVEQFAPDAHMINFSNPVGIITQAVTQHTRARILGICDTPTELFEEAAATLHVPSAECHFDYVGLNHLGWLREVYLDGKPRLSELIARPERLYRADFFEREWLTTLRLLPTEYVYFYTETERALQGIRSAGRSRGEQLEAMNRKLFEELRVAEQPLRVYEAYLDARNNSYMLTESGGGGTRPPAFGELTGYDKIALATMRAIYFNLGIVLPLNVPNRGNLPELADEDIVEIPCRVDRNGAHPLHVGRIPEQVRQLVLRVKEYERRTLAAASTRAESEAVAALSCNPLVPSAKLARQLVHELAVLSA
jgi:6-phospho-beta-glucosidase